MVSFCGKIVGTLVIGLLLIPGPVVFAMPRALVKVVGVEISVEIPDTPELQYKGLGQRDYLPEFEGMLFIFPAAGFHAFHMKDMLFPIDIIWIRSHLIVDISRNVPVPTGSDLPIYIPGTEADMVLEVNSNFTGRHNIRVGDKVVINPLTGIIPDLLHAPVGR